jgi:phosphatidylserine/phosphatidylglycerophosphate/cardiolipin synthase-like enzyme
MLNLSKRQFYFSPEDDTTKEFLAFMATAQKSIRLADFSFNLVPLVDLLIQKFKAGVDVQLVLDKSQSGGKSEVPEVKAILAAGIPCMIGESTDHKIMHNKFTIIDGEVVQYGSWNYTAVASDEDNFFVIDQEPIVAEAFMADWQKMFDYIKSQSQTPAPKKAVKVKVTKKGK